MKAYRQRYLRTRTEISADKDGDICGQKRRYPPAKPHKGLTDKMHIVVTIPSTGISYDAKLRWQNFYVHTQITERNTHFTEFPEITRTRALEDFGRCGSPSTALILPEKKVFHNGYMAH